jgi:hypothetical protein
MYDLLAYIFYAGLAVAAIVVFGVAFVCGKAHERAQWIKGRRKLK